MKQLFLLIPLFLLSCNNDDTDSLSGNSQNGNLSARETDNVVYVDENGVEITTETEIQPYVGEFNQPLNSPASTNATTYTLVGYTSKEKISTETVYFTSQPVDKRLSAGVYYPATVYHYKYKITVPHGATVVYPTEVSETAKTGVKPGTTNVPGYILNNISKGEKGDVYEFVTKIKEITHNGIGQSLGFTAYLPFRVGNPSTDLIFKYYVEEIDWGEM